MLINKRDVVLFQGDSITDAGRDRTDPTSLGSGFAMIAGGWFSARFPEMKAKFLNRGIGGDRTKDLVRRWQEDCLVLQPTVVSILIGINNTWRRYDSNDPTPVERFEQEYRNILDRTVSQIHARLILCEPFLLPVTDQQKIWREDLDPKIAVVRKLAVEYNALLIPLDTVFAKAATKRKAKFWLPDGVHPSPAGAALIARAWLKVVKAA